MIFCFFFVRYPLFRTRNEQLEYALFTRCLFQAIKLMRRKRDVITEPEVYNITYRKAAREGPRH